VRFKFKGETLDGYILSFPSTDIAQVHYTTRTAQGRLKRVIATIKTKRLELIKSFHNTTLSESEA
jgi:hypothetical protein